MTRFKQKSAALNPVRIIPVRHGQAARRGAGVKSAEARAGEAARGGFADGCRVILAGHWTFSHLCEQNGAIHTNLSLSEESLFSYEIDNVIN